MDGLSKVRPGEPLRIPAKAYNAFVNAALDHQQRSMSTTGDALRDQKNSNLVLVKNESGSARAQFDVLGIDGPIITRANNPEAFRSRIALRGVTPTAEHVGRFVILHDALPSGTVGRAYVAGACLARVRMQDEAHTAADIDDGQVGQLASGEGGAASLLWVEPVEERTNPEIAWAVVRFGGGVGGTVTVSSPVIIALLTSVQRFSEANPDLPAYHWREAQVTPDGAAVEKADGEGSKTIPSCDSIVVDAENAAYSALAAPVVGNLPVSAFDPENGTMTVTIAGTEDTAHTVSAYRIRAGTDFVVGGGWADYGNSGVLPPGQAPSFEFTGIPLYTDIYVTITTNTSDAGTNHNRYIIRFGMNGIEPPIVAVEVADLNDPAGALLTTPASGEYGGEIADGVTDLALAWSTAPGATHYYVTAGTVYGDPNSLPGTWNLADHDVGSATTDTITDAPADGTPFWVTLWWRTAPSFEWSWNRWRITITPSPDRRAANLEDINTLEEGGAIIPAPPVDEMPLPNPILVEILLTKDSVGNDRFVFVRSEGGNAVGATLAYAQIDSSIGTSPPFIYTARAVVANGTGGFGAPVGIDFDLYNLAEIGAGSSGVHAVPDGSIVAYWQDEATGERFFDRSFYRGTF
jgi:hypothetical protein